MSDTTATSDTAPTPDPPSASQPALARERFREILSHWAASVSVLAVRDPDDGRVYATTLTSFTPVAADPPTVLVSLGAGAQALPFLTPGDRYVVNLLAREQSRLAQVFADSFPVGPSPFRNEGDPVIEGVLASLVCRVTELHDLADGGRLVLGTVVAADVDPTRDPLLYRRRRYAVLTEEDPG